MNHTVFLALGTNIGDRCENLKRARSVLPSNVILSACSPIYETPPWGYENQPDFLNQVVKGQTHLTPLELLSFLKEVEVKIGRVASFHYGPREIDIDILFYDDIILSEEDIIIPHPHIAERVFVLIPLADLEPGFIHPKLKMSIKDLLAKLNTRGIKKYAECNIIDSVT